MANSNRQILTKDVEGFKANGPVKSTIAKWTGGDQYSTVNVLRGELVESRPTNNLDFNICLSRDPSVWMCLKGDDLAPLSEEEFLLLEAIKSPGDRFTAFTDGKLEWGTKLTKGTDVSVEVYGQGSVTRQIQGTIMFKGQVQGKSGVLFGVKVYEKRVGKSDGIHNGRRYFNCEPGQGLFVSLNRLSPHQGTGRSNQERKSHPTDHGHAEDSPSDNTRLKTKMKESSVDKPSDILIIGNRVGFFDKLGRKKFGTVKWMGRSTPARTFEFNLVGIHTDEIVYQSDFERSVLGLHHHVKAPRDHSLVLPESLVDLVQEKREEESITSMIAQQENKPKDELLKDQNKMLQEAAGAKQQMEDKQLAEAVEGLGEDIEEQLKRFQELENKKQHPMSNKQQNSDKHRQEDEHEDQHRINRQNVSSGDYEHERTDKYHSEKYRENQQPVNGSQTYRDNPIVASSGNGPFFNLHVDSMVQIPCTDSNDVPYRYGIIRWIGHIPKMPDQVAGIELDEYMSGCGDGSWTDQDGNSHQFFKCPYGKGLYYPLHSLQPDAKFSSQRSLYDNPLADVPQSLPDSRTVPVNTDISIYIGERKGIQGHQNSCYLDSTIFGLFALSEVFDEMFLRDQNSPVGKILWLNIVNPLRAHGVVKYESVMELRNQLEKLGKMSGITSDEKDPEEFLNLMFKHSLKVNPFISIRRPYGIEPEYFVQLFLEVSDTPEPARLGSLLNKMFTEQNISFTEIPSKLLIQVPRYGKKFQSFQKVIPDIRIDISAVTDSVQAGECFFCQEQEATEICEDCYKEFNSKTVLAFCRDCYRRSHKHSRLKHTSRPCQQGESKLDLLSVLCIETSHYVCFSRHGQRWLFFDSMSNRVYDQYNIPKVEDCSKVLNEWVYPKDNNIDELIRAKPRELPELVRRFTQDIYLCVYVSKDFGLY